MPHLSMRKGNRSRLLGPRASRVPRSDPPRGRPHLQPLEGLIPGYAIHPVRTSPGFDTTYP